MTSDVPDHDSQPRRRLSAPLWLVETLDIVQLRRRLLLSTIIAVVLAGTIATAVAPGLIPPVPAVGAALGFAALLLGLAAIIAVDASDLIVRGPRHVRAAGGELVAILPSRVDPATVAALARAALDAREPDGKLLLGLASTGNPDPQYNATLALTDALGFGIAQLDVSVLRADLSSGISPQPGLYEVVRDEVRLARAVTFERDIKLAWISAGRDVAGALAGIPGLPSTLPRDLDVLLVALPVATSRQVVRAAAALQHVLLVVERGRTSRVDLIASLDAMEVAGCAAQVVLLDDRTANWLGVTAQPRQRKKKTEPHAEVEGPDALEQQNDAGADNADPLAALEVAALSAAAQDADRHAQGYGDTTDHVTDQAADHAADHTTDDAAVHAALSGPADEPLAVADSSEADDGVDLDVEFDLTALSSFGDAGSGERWAPDDADRASEPTPEPWARPESRETANLHDTLPPLPAIPDALDPVVPRRTPVEPGDLTDTEQSDASDDAGGSVTAEPPPTSGVRVLPTDASPVDEVAPAEAAAADAADAADAHEIDRAEDTPPQRATSVHAEHGDDADRHEGRRAAAAWASGSNKDEDGFVSGVRILPPGSVPGGAVSPPVDTAYGIPIPNRPLDEDVAPTLPFPTTEPANASSEAEAAIGADDEPFSEPSTAREAAPAREIEVLVDAAAEVAASRAEQRGDDDDVLVIDATDDDGDASPPTASSFGDARSVAPAQPLPSTDPHRPARDDASDPSRSSDATSLSSASDASDPNGMGSPGGRAGGLLGEDTPTDELPPMEGGLFASDDAPAAGRGGRDASRDPASSMSLDQPDDADPLLTTAQLAALIDEVQGRDERP